VDSTPIQTAVLRGGVYIGHPSHRRGSQRGGRHSLQAARACGGGEASLGGNLCKSDLRVSVCSFAGRQAILLSTFTTWHGGWRGRRAAGCGHLLPQMAANQVSCPSTLQAAKSSSLSVRTVQVEGASLLCDLACGITRPLVPLADRQAVFHAIHNVAHPGIRATKRMVTARFVWKGVGRDVAAMCRECQQCQRGKVHKQPAAPLQAIPVPARKFSHVHVDLVGPLPASSDGHVYLLTIIDRSTRWFEAVPLRNMEASTCVDAFIANWVARFGLPETVTTDRGAQFTSALWSSACTSLGINHVLTTAYLGTTWPMCGT
jgi:hypothetical protein